jgi:plasmid stabilization system protein ParE
MTKRYAVVFTPRAESHLENLYAYIADNSAEERAERFVGRIIETCVSLSMFPKRGTNRDDIRPNLRTTYHAGRVTIAYTVDDDNLAVAVLGIYYGGQDFERLLEDTDDQEL